MLLDQGPQGHRQGSVSGVIEMYIGFLSSCKKILATSNPSTFPRLLFFPLFLLKIILHDISIQVDSLLVNVKHICPVQFL